MTIDWFTFTAQILNFLILVWLMKRFLYGPVVQAIDRREAAIANRLSDAAQAHQSARDSEQEYRRRRRQLDEDRAGLMTTAVQEVAAWRQQQLDDARSAAQQARQQWQTALTRDQQRLQRELQQHVAALATDVAAHLLQQLADDTLQSRLINRCRQLLAETDESTRQALTAAEQHKALTVETSHPLAAAQQDQIRSDLNRITGGDTGVQFQQNPDLICGIELRTPDFRLAWSIRETLAELHTRLLQVLEETLPETLPAAPATANSAATPEISVA